MDSDHKQSEAEREAHVALALVTGIGAFRLAALRRRFGSAEQALRARFEELVRVDGMTELVAAAVNKANREAAREALRSAAQMGAQVLVPDDPGYPAMLRSIPNPPPVLFVHGNAGILAAPAVAIVGSRDHSAYGAEVGRALGRAAARAGLVVVSGMARGLDSIAHMAALDGGGATIGVLGTGLGVIYPATNRDLYDRVVKQGLLLTEFPPGAPPTAGSFARRNRLISGLARVTVVVEAAELSGTLGTVRHALDQGREVLAVPGPITSRVSAGTNALIRDGAGPLLELRDLLDHYPELEVRRADPAPSDPEGPPLFGRLLAALGKQPLPAGQLIEQCGAPVGEALAALSALELRGTVRQEAGLYRTVAAGLFG